ncbi:MAG: glycosyltransferase family 4 protein [Bacteroidales bacterium]|jgi:glycosyltransferase involved in cell wall biosynthesis|nr:glycosyltransferase family 4 protein [Bacteroidales bacterium]
MKRKKLLIDLSILKHPYCGLGQVATNYGNYFKEHFNNASQQEFEIILLVSKRMFGMFGTDVSYQRNGFLPKLFPFLLPRVDIWHAIHQRPSYKPFARSTKYIVTIHDYNFMYEKIPQKAHKYLRKMQRDIDRANTIVAISEFAKHDIERFSDLRGKTVEVIYNGVERLDPDKARRPSVVENDKPFFFTIGQVREKKNFHTLLDCMKLFPEKQLYIAGEAVSDYARKMQERIENENIHNVKMLGTISNEERIWFYKNCEAFLFPSLFEGFGLPVIEAMQFGKPVFSSQETSLKEIGGECAYFWNNFDPKYMKSVIDNNLEKFKNSPELQEKTIAYAHSFSYKKHFERYINLYKNA